MDVVSSTPVTLWVDFAAPQGLVIPDVGRTFFSLYDGEAVPLLVQQALTPAADATGVSIPIPAIHHVLAPDRLFERRTVLVTFEANGRSYSAVQRYRVVELPAYAATPADVRAYLAINEDELADEEVDLFSAYTTLAAAVGQDLLETALGSGTLAALRAERAVVLTAATALFPSLRFRIAQSKTDGTMKFERLKDPTAFADLVAATQAELAGIVQGLTGSTEVAALPPTLIMLGIATTDPVTGTTPATGV